MKKIGACFLMYQLMLLFVLETANAQVKFGENKTTINAGSLLELESSASPYKAVLLPRISISTTTTWSLNGSGVAAMMLYNTNAAITSSNTSYPVLPGGTGMYYWDGTGWLGMTAPKGTANGQYWSLTGNSGTTASTSAIGTAVNNNFIGTTDAKDVAFATNNLERMRILSGGNIGIGTLAPQELLQIGNATAGTNSPGILMQSSANTNGQGGIIRFREVNYPGSNYGMDIRHNTESNGGTNEGLYFDRVFSGVTTNAMFIDEDNGNIGMGTTAPANNLSVVNGSKAVNVDLSNTTDATLQVKSANTSAWSRLGTNGSPLVIITAGSDNSSTTPAVLISNTGNVGIGLNTPAARLDDAGTFKLGANGTVHINEISFSGTVSGTAIAAGTGGASVFNAAGTDVTITIPAANRPTTTQAIVTVSPNSDLPASVSIASAYLTSTSVVKVRFVNASTTARTLASSTFYVNIKEF